MVKLNLEAQGTEQQAVLSYLQENVSKVLADKINNGVYIEKDGKRLLNKKDLNGFMRYACDEARKQAAKGSNSACIQDSVVSGQFTISRKIALKVRCTTTTEQSTRKLLSRQHLKQMLP